MPKHGSIILYVHGNQKARYDGQPRTSTSTLTQLRNYNNDDGDDDNNSNNSTTASTTKINA